MASVSTPSRRTSLVRLLSALAALAGALATGFALYEIVMAQRHVPYIEGRLDICDPLQPGGPAKQIGEALAERSGKFAYVALTVTAYGDDCSRPLHGDPETGRVLAYQEVLAHLGPLTAAPDANTTYLGFSPAGMRDAFLMELRQELAEDPGYLELDGLVAVKARPGEGDLYFTLTPAPFDSITFALATCTRALANKSLGARIRAYLTRCISN